ncbi:hypothetical protein OHA72_44000 [Dactylosporangium sp. NBC_01737]|uniref:hypothetical protein n=1 Tax=Dactylosporangium sp. NBC_01737 TaxID=2975959 RepID=UPI002E12A885|nr:hypothetical protein OHA72_44000 [Dactylosporangium sp. NBC_01737]
MLKQLEPGAAELAAHRQELTGLLAAPLSTIAEHAYTALQTLHGAAALDAATLTEITAGMLSRPEKKLVRAHLTWLRRLSLDDLLDGLVVGLHHPVAELAGRTLDLIEPRLAGLPPAARERLRDEVPALDGAVGQRLAALLGTAAPPRHPSRCSSPRCRRSSRHRWTWVLAGDRHRAAQGRRRPGPARAAA